MEEAVLWHSPSVFHCTLSIHCSVPRGTHHFARQRDVLPSAQEVLEYFIKSGARRAMLRDLH